MKKLRIGFSRPKTWMIGSALIRLFERAEFSHAYLRWSAESLQRDLVYQASHGMVHFVSGARFDEQAQTVREYEISLTDEQFNEVVKKCVDLAGVKYGLLQLAGMSLERLSGLRNPFRDGDKTFVCSELVGTVLNILYKIDMDLEFAGPRQLEKLLSSLSMFKRIA